MVVQQFNFVDRIELSVSDNTLPLKLLCLEATNSTFQGPFYCQIHDPAMGSHASVIAANKVMKTIEEEALTTFSYPSQYWARYVDNLSVINLKKYLEKILTI